jgi:MFS family permease
MPPGPERPTTTASTASASSWSLLRDPPFRRFFIGSTVSNLGTWLQNTAQMLLAYQLTHSAFAVGLVTAAQFSGILVVGPWAGSVADRLGHRRVLAGSQLISAAIAGGLAALRFSNLLTEPDLIYGAIVTGLALAFALPVQSAMVSGLVAERNARAALAMNSVSYNAGRTLAPVLYLLVLTSIGAGWAFALNGLSYLIFAGTTIAIRPARLRPRDIPLPDLTGLRLAVRQPHILLLLAMVATITIADDPVQVLGPPLARDVLFVSGIWPAYFLSALGLGTVIGSLLPARLATSRQAAVTLGLLAVAVLVFAIGFRPWLSLIAATAAGTAALLTGASAQALLLQTAGPRSATQVMALWAVAWAGTKPIASMADGWLAANLDVQWAAVILVTPAVTVALLELCLRDPLRGRLREFVRRIGESGDAA